MLYRIHVYEHNNIGHSTFKRAHEIQYIFVPMRLNHSLLTFFCSITICFYSCKKEGTKDPTPPATIVDVYAAGYNDGKVVYWKNGVEITLSTSIYFDETAWGIVVSGSDVYVAGKKKSNAVYWKNGVENFLYNIRWI